jgi:hypothetical protein
VVVEGELKTKRSVAEMPTEPLATQVTLRYCRWGVCFGSGHGRNKGDDGDAGAMAPRPDHIIQN